jgi:hypothetical protein
MSLVQATRDVWLRLDADPPQPDREDRQPGQPVRVEVTEQHHSLAAPPGQVDSLDEPTSVRQQARIVQGLTGRREERLEIGGGGH